MRTDVKPASKVVAAFLTALTVLRGTDYSLDSKKEISLDADARCTCISIKPGNRVCPGSSMIVALLGIMPPPVTTLSILSPSMKTSG